MKKTVYGIILMVFLFALAFFSGCSQRNTITYVWNEATSVADVIEAGSAVIPPEEIEIEGYVFGGWYADQQCNDPFVFTVMPEYDITVYALLIPVYDVTFDTGTADNVTPQKIIEGNLINLPSVSRSGYTLEGWYVSYSEGATLDEKWSFTDNVVTSNITLYANWISNDEAPLAYTVYLDACGGEISFNTKSISAGESIGSLPTVTRTGYGFTGWNTKNDGSGTNIDSADSFNADITLYAQWSPLSLNITVNTSDGNDAYIVNYSYGEDIETPDTPSRDGYAFGGWYTDKDYINRCIFNSMPAESFSIYAQWIPEYNISFVSNGGSIIEEISVIEGENLSLPECIKTGYILDGWYVSYNGGDTLEDKWSFSSDIVKEDMTLYANWTADTYWLSINVDETVVSRKSVTFDSFIGELPISAITGYTFDNWNTAPDGSGDVIDETTLYDYNTDITIYAIFTVNQYTITFETGSGTPVDSITADYGAEVNKPNDPILANNTFAGWYTSETAILPYQFTTMPADDVTLYADWGTIGLFYTLINDNAEYSVSVGTATDIANIYIPRRFNLKPVTQIAEDAFNNDLNIINIVIPSTINVIEDSAFYECNNLNTIEFKEGLEIIGEEAFYNCISINNINIPSTVTDIGAQAFRGCLVASITGGSGLLTLGYGVFSACKAMTSFTIPDSIDEIGANLFSDCDTLEYVKLSDNLTFIPENCFYLCKALQSVIIPDSVISINNDAFVGSGIKQIIIPNSVLSIGSNLFYGSEYLESVSIGNGITEISDDSFHDCISLSNVSIGNSVTVIGNYVFASCYGLTEIILPDRITDIGSYAFIYCNNLEYIKLPSMLSEISDNVFGLCSKLNNINIPSSVSSLGNRAFMYCESLTSITIPGSIDSIGEQAFIQCSSLKEVYINNGVNVIEIGAFSGCGALENVYFNTMALQTIELSAFYNCYSLRELVIPVSSFDIDIQSYAFANCYLLEKVILSEDVDSIDQSAFCNCFSLSEVYVYPVAPPTADDDIFENCYPGMKIYVKSTSLAAYESDPYWNAYSIEAMA